MEIIHITLGKANPERMNGVNKVVYQLATEQKLAGRNVRLWGFSKDTIHNYPKRNFKTQLFQTYVNKFKLDKNFVSEINAISKDTVFHIHGGFNPLFYSITKLLVRQNLKYVFTPHGAYNAIAMKRSWLRKKLYSSLFEKSIIKNAKYIHCIGKSEILGLKSINKKAKSMLIPYGFEMANTKPHVPNNHNLIIGFCGRIDIKTKGLDILIQSFDTLKKVIPKAELWLIGDSSEKEQLMKMVKKANISGVNFLGSKFGAEKDNLLKQVHIFLHPSRNEGLPSAVLEAASLGIPCVVTEATNVGESINKYNCGAVIKALDNMTLFYAIMQVYKRLQKEGWVKMSEAAMNMVKYDYNWKKIVIDFDKLYA